MKHTAQVQAFASFIATAHALTSPAKASQPAKLAGYQNHPALALLTPYKRMVRAGLELRLNNMQIAKSLKTIGDPRIDKLSTCTLSNYVSVIRSHNKMPRSRGFLSQW